MSNSKTPQPFFARFLESQEAGPDTTMKFPSDGEDGGGGDWRAPTAGAVANEVTLKYPSDSEDEGGGGDW